MNYSIKMEDKTNFDISIETRDGKPFEIPLQGSLGLLALGDVGLMTWRKRKIAAYEQAQKQKRENP